MANFPTIKLTAQNLCVSRGGFQILEGLNFALTSGQFMPVTGVNGAGKSTLLMALAQLIAHDGNMSFDIANHDFEEQPLTELIHYVAHQNALKPDLTPQENLEFWADLYHGDRSLIPTALEQASIDKLANIAAGKLSKGQQRRVALSRLLIAKRPVWILDEPTSALDKEGDEWVSQLISNHLRANGMVIAATHRPIAPANGIEIVPLHLGGAQ